MTFGQNLQRLRNKARLSQAGLAERSGISVNTIQNWEIDRHQPRIDALPMLAQALGVGLESLIVSKNKTRKIRSTKSKKAARV
jgi:transcriptional regulator with XRE-family HTH domain